MRLHEARFGQRPRLVKCCAFQACRQHVRTSICFEASVGQVRLPLAAIGASTITANVLVEANAASVIRTKRCLSELRSMVFSLRLIVVEECIVRPQHPSGLWAAP